MHSPYRTPDFITGEIRKLCQQLDASQEPVYVSVSTEPGCVLGDCYGNVQRKVDTCAGHSQHGWNIQVWPNVLLDAQFHAVYVAPDGSAVDITPNQNGSNRILFLPDSTPQFTAEAGRIPNVRVALNDDREVGEYIALTDEKDRLETEGGVPPTRGYQRWVQIQPRRAVLVYTLLSRYTPKRGRCPCGSGKKYKYCCYGMAIEQQLERWGNQQK